MVPSSGTVTWKSPSTSSSRPSTSTSALSVSSTSSTVGLGAPDRGEQRAGEQELLAEDVVAGLVPRLVGPARGDPQQLLGVVPLVQRAGLVDALVALQPDQPGVRRRGDGLGQLGLADAGGALDQQRLAEAVGEEDRGRDGGGREVADVGEPVRHVVDGAEQRRLGQAHTLHPAL